MNKLLSIPILFILATSLIPACAADKDAKETAPTKNYPIEVYPITNEMPKAKNGSWAPVDGATNAKAFNNFRTQLATERSNLRFNFEDNGDRKNDYYDHVRVIIDLFTGYSAAGGAAPGKNMAGQLVFLHDDFELPEDYDAGGKIILYFHFKDYEATLKTLEAHKTGTVIYKVMRDANHDLHVIGNIIFGDYAPNPNGDARDR